MKRTRLALLGAISSLLVYLPACKGSARSSSIQCGGNCSAFQHTDSLPERPPSGVIRLAIGGDSRDDLSGVVPWAFKEAARRGAKAFVFLGDLELTPKEDELFLRKLKDLDGIPLYPVMGNHEIESFGVVRPSDADSKERVKQFKDRFIKVPVNLAPLDHEAVYSADLEGNVHFIALDNVSQRGEGFSAAQLAWLEKDLTAAAAAKKVILVGMHKALARNPVTNHAMDEDGAKAVQDSDNALQRFTDPKHKVAMLFVSHSHMYASYNQQGVEVRLTGGLGAPLVKGLAEGDGGFHHFLLLDVPQTGGPTPLHVEVVKFPGVSTRDKDDESKEKEVE